MAGELGVPLLCCCPMPGGGWASGTPSNPLTQIASGSSPPHSPPGSCMGSNFSASASASAQLSIPLWAVTPALHGDWGGCPPPCAPSTEGWGLCRQQDPQRRPPFPGIFIAGQELQTRRKCVSVRGSPSLWPLTPMGPCSTHISARPQGSPLLRHPLPQDSPAHIAVSLMVILVGFHGGMGGPPVRFHQK